MRRVLSVIHFPVFGGPHNLARRLASPLEDHGWETLVLLPDEPGNAAQLLRDEDVDVVTMPLGRLRASTDVGTQMRFVTGAAAQIWAIRRLIRDRRIDLVQVAGLVNPHAAIAARLEGVPVVWQLLDTRAPRPVAVASMAFVEQLADAVMSTGAAVAQAHPRYGAIRDRLVTFFPPVDTDLFRPMPESRAETRTAWGVPADAPVIGCVANINPQKGIVELVEAFGLARRAIPDARLVVVGAEYATHKGYSARVREVIRDLGLEEGRDVIFPGARFDHQFALAGFDCFAFAPIPRGEGITTAVLEAMASGLPVVCTSVAGLPEAVKDGESGRLVPPGDRSAMANAIVGLLTDPRCVADLGDAARSRAIRLFATSRCVERHLLAYDTAVGRHRAAFGARASEPSPVTRAQHGADETAATSGAAPWSTLPFECPVCGVRLDVSADNLRCPGCMRSFPVTDGIPILTPDVAASAHDELDHEHGSPDDHAEHRRQQASHFDRDVAAEFEIDRPHGAPRLYRFLLGEKFRRSTRPIGPELIGATALTVCGGSGMDAEFLARAGARVVASDISIGAARRTRERARRYGVDITPIVADAEHLPFPRDAFDLVYVHDGLHHLEEPAAGLAEMTRVARRWVSVSEPARAVATNVAISMGLALEREDAGNVVARLTPEAVVQVLRTGGFEAVVARRYAMYYRHRPGAVFGLLSRSLIFPVVRLGWFAGNRLIGRFGNKMVVVAAQPWSSFGDPEDRPLAAPAQTRASAP